MFELAYAAPAQPHNFCISCNLESNVLVRISPVDSTVISLQAANLWKYAQVGIRLVLPACPPRAQ